MRKLVTTVLFAGALAILSLAVDAQPAWASDTDCSSCGFFAGALVNSVTSAMSPISGAWTGTFTEDVFQSAGVYTYVFDLTLNTMKPGDQLSSTSTGLGASVLDFFDSTLSWGVVTGTSNGPLTNTSSGVDDNGFTFTPSTLQALVTGMNGSGKTFEFYAQSTLPPGAGRFNVINGGITSTESLDPAPEPSSILLFGSGLLVLGMMFRRRLTPQLPQLR